MPAAPGMGRRATGPTTLSRRSAQAGAPAQQPEQEPRRERRGLGAVCGRGRCRTAGPQGLLDRRSGGLGGCPRRRHADWSGRWRPDRQLSQSHDRHWAVTSAKLGLGAVTAARIAAGTIVASNIGFGQIHGGLIKPDAINSSKVVDNTLTADDLATNSVGCRRSRRTGCRPPRSPTTRSTPARSSTSLSNQDVGVLFAAGERRRHARQLERRRYRYQASPAGNYEVDFGGTSPAAPRRHARRGRRRRRRRRVMASPIATATRRHFS